MPDEDLDVVLHALVAEGFGLPFAARSRDYPNDDALRTADAQAHQDNRDALCRVLAGRLLPDGGETRTEWEVRWHSGPDDGICMEERYHASRASAETTGPTRIGQYGITRYSVHRREHRIFEDGSSWSGPWVEVTDEVR